MCRLTKGIDNVIAQGGRQQGEQIATGGLMLKLAFHIFHQDCRDKVVDGQTDAGDCRVTPPSPNSLKVRSQKRSADGLVPQNPGSAALPRRNLGRRDDSRLTGGV